MELEDLLTLVGVGGAIYWVLNNRTKTRTKDTIREVHTRVTENGSITYEREREVDSRTTELMREGTQRFVANRGEYRVASSPPTEIDRERSKLTSSHIVEVPVMTSKPAPLTTTYREVNTTSATPPNRPVIIEAVKESGKQCPHCSKTLPHSMFRPNSNHPDGLTKWCGQCLDKQASNKSQDRHHKICPKCSQRRLKTNFDKNGNTPDGLTKWCRYCMKG